MVLYSFKIFFGYSSFIVYYNYVVLVSWTISPLLNIIELNGM